MRTAQILADHQELWEGSRIIPAISIAVAMTGTALVFVLVGLRRDSNWLGSASGGVAAVGLALVLAAAFMGSLPRDTSRGYEICGPVLFEPLPAEGENCRPVMSGPTTVFAVTTLAGFGLLIGSSLRGRQRGTAGVGDV